MWPWMQDPGAKGVRRVPSRTTSRRKLKRGALREESTGKDHERSGNRQNPTQRGSHPDGGVGGGRVWEWEVEVEDSRNRKLEAPGDHHLEVALGLWLPCSLTGSLTQTGLNQPGQGSEAAQIHSEMCKSGISHIL